MTAAGAEVIRLRSTDGAPTSGHALLIGAPLGRLRGVDTSLNNMQIWLGEHGFEAISTTESTKAEIERQMTALVDEVQPGDFVLLYYAGHGVQVLPGQELSPWPLVVQLPIDTFEVKEVIPGDVWQAWLRALSSKADAASRTTPGVTVIFDCCHAQGMLAQWPDAEARERVMVLVTRGLENLDMRFRGDELSDVVLVFASGRDESARVGQLTAALLRLLRTHATEPWWALMDRLRAGWDRTQQNPGVTGPVDRLPMSSERLKRPDRLVPAVWRDDDWWVEAGRVIGWRPGHWATLTPSLGLPAQAWAQVQSDASRLRVVGPVDGWRTDDGFAWARPTRLVPRATVGLGGVEPQRSEVRRRLRDLVKAIVELPEPTRVASKTSTELLLRFEARADGTVDLVDGDGEVVARTALDDGATDTWAVWIERLLTLEQWLAVARSSGWQPRGLQLRWGEWTDGTVRPWPDEPRAIQAGAPLWLQVAVQPSERAFVSVFRVRADRSVEDLTAHAPGGLPIGGHHPQTQLGQVEAPLRLAWPAGVSGGRRAEQLVVIVSQRPVPLSSLSLEVVKRAPVKRDHGQRPTEGNMAMVVRRYWLVLAQTPAPGAP